MGLSSTLNVAIVSTLTSILDMVTPTAKLSYSKDYVLKDGTLANEANQIFSDTRTIAASGNETIDLAGTLTNALGQTITFTKIKAIIIEAAAANTNDVNVGPNSATGFVAPWNAAADRNKVKPGGLFMVVAPDLAAYATAAGSTDLLYIQNGGGTTSVTYSIVIIGVA